MLLELINARSWNKHWSPKPRHPYRTSSPTSTKPFSSPLLNLRPPRKHFLQDHSAQVEGHSGRRRQEERLAQWQPPLAPLAALGSVRPDLQHWETVGRSGRPRLGAEEG